MGRFRQLLDRYYRVPETPFLVAMAFLVGIASAILGLVFRSGIDYFSELFFKYGGNVLGFLGRYYVVFLPVIGGLLVGPLIYTLAREAKGHGVPEVMAAVAVRGGKIRPRVVVVKSLASALTIGSGGSAGSEGPIVQIGAGIGSTLGQIFHLSEERLKILVSCGAAAGIATVFNAPIAGVFFALEVINGQFSTNFFSLVVISSVTASIIARAFIWGNNPVFAVPQYGFQEPLEVIFYITLGVLAGIFAYFEIKTTYFVEDIFEAWKQILPWVKPAIGGLVVGLIGIYFPQVFGAGYETIELALAGKLAGSLLLVLIFLKLIAVTFTLGSGGSGGVFAPSLFMGAMLGGAFGVAMEALFPDLTANPGAYALVGMGAVFAGAAQAPITSIIMIFEMTNDYRIILPLMITSVISYMLASFLSKESIYTLKLSRRGIKLHGGREKSIMEKLSVAGAMHREVDTVPSRITCREMGKIVRHSKHTGFPVVDNGKLVGMVTFYDIRKAIDQGKEDRLVADLMTKEILVAYPEENLNQAMQKFGLRGIGRLPVVEKDNPKKLVGIITRSDIIKAYNRELLKLEHCMVKITPTVHEH